MKGSAWFVVILLLPFSGCLREEAPPPVIGEEEDEGIQAPWWPLGKWWNITLQRGTNPVQKFDLVNFWNDTETSHFWVGVENRAIALDHALHDNNPLLGRIHHGLLTPHEKGMHAHGMYTFPILAGEEFDGLMFDREWSLKAANGTKPGTLAFTGTATDGAKIKYDYDPAYMWFTFIEIKNPDGTLDMRADVGNHGLGKHGTFYFLRGRDLYFKQNVPGTMEERFDVPGEPEEAGTIKQLAFEINGQTNGVLRIELKNPQGATVKEHQLAAQSDRKIFEVDAVDGKWTVAYTGGGTFTGTIEVVGIVPITKSI